MHSSTENKRIVEEDKKRQRKKRALQIVLLTAHIPKLSKSLLTPVRIKIDNEIEVNRVPILFDGIFLS